MEALLWKPGTNWGPKEPLSVVLHGAQLGCSPQGWTARGQRGKEGDTSYGHGALCVAHSAVARMWLSRVPGPAAHTEKRETENRRRMQQMSLGVLCGQAGYWESPGSLLVGRKQEGDLLAGS